jgi:hypothetical protein
MYCKNCEGSEFEEKTSLVLGEPNVSVDIWILYQCKECKLLKLVHKIESKESQEQK